MLNVNFNINQTLKVLKTLVDEMSRISFGSSFQSFRTATVKHGQTSVAK